MEREQGYYSAPLLLHDSGKYQIKSIRMHRSAQPAETDEELAESTVFWRPDFRENVWWIDTKTDTALMRTLKGSFEVPVPVALMFMKIRTHCTGHNTPADIAQKIGVTEEEVLDVLEVFVPAGIFRGSEEMIEPAHISSRFAAAIELWAEEVAATCLVRTNLGGTLHIGLLLEDWHLANAMHAILAKAKEHCPVPLKEVLSTCKKEYESLQQADRQSLEALGFFRQEIEESIPLPSTRLLVFLIEELMRLDLVAWMMVMPLLAARYPAQAGDMFHTGLFTRYKDHFTQADRTLLDALANKIHDLVHAFILQAQEIKGYYAHLNGNYLPRQPVGFFAL